MRRVALWILLALVATFAVSVALIAPRFASVFEQLPGSEEGLPVLTRCLMGVSAWLVRWWWTIPLAAGAVVVAFRLRRSSDREPAGSRG